MKNFTAVTAALCAALAALPVAAGDLAGVPMPERISVEGRQLALNGMGLRSKAIFKVYVAGLYAEQKSNDASNLISSDQVKQVRMVMMRDLKQSQIAEAVIEGFEKNSKASMPALQARLNQFIAQVPDLKSGETLVITYVPGQGTTLWSTSGSKKTVPGKDFADAMFSVWLGESPVDSKLKAGLLGG